MKAIGGNDSGKVKHARVEPKKKIDPSSPPTTVELRGIRVHFPFKPYSCQEAYMGKVLDALFRSENALLESPTGTGKTLCLLCATLAWQSQQQRTLREAAEIAMSQPQENTLVGHQDGPKQAARCPQIIYASRTHSQLSQVVRELRNTRYRPQHAVLASREQMCVNPKVKKKNSTASDINHDCNKLGKERKCRYRNSLEGFVPPTQEQRRNQQNYQPVMDMEELIDMGKTSHVCPFYYTRGQVENAELIFVPYNYLFDKDARETTLSDVRWENAVVIFDEAHNLESFASDSASFDLSNTDIAGCMNEVQRATNYLHSMPDLNYNLKEDNLALLTRAFENLENYVLSLGNQTAYSGEFMMEVFRKGAGITHANHLLFIEELRKVNDMIMDLRGTGATRGSPRLEHFVTCLKRVFCHKLEARCLAKASSYRVHISPQTAGEKNAARTISYWCFAPSLAMEELANLKVRSILVTSGTLSPLPSYSMELGLPFPHTLENPHIIQPSQVHVRVVGKGVSGKLLSSSYERRQDAEYFSELGNTLASLSRVIPAGMLIFFPSYSVMETCIERWGGPSLGRPNKNNGKSNFFAERRKAIATKSYAFPRVIPTYNTSAFGSPSSPWKRLLAAKAIVVEPRASGDLPDAISEFKKFLGMEKSSGCVLMGVCRGKISEGIDFAHDMSRAVIITGIPFAPSFDAKVKMKREFLDSAKSSAAVNHLLSVDGRFGGMTASTGLECSKLSGNEWYTQQAHRAVNQAIGRVIRNRTDYGAVLLLDSRFDQPRNREGLSRWVRPYVLGDEGFGPAVKALGEFYKESAEEAKVRAQSMPTASQLSYEDEKLSDNEGSNGVNRIAVISEKSGSADGEYLESVEDAAYVAPDRVVARFEVGGTERREEDRVPTRGQKPAAAATFDSVFNQKKPLPHAPKPPKKAAAIFMEKTKTLMTVIEQSNIRKLIVMMKKQGDNKDVKGFRRSAGDIIDMILKAEKHESPPSLNDERMLFLFLELVPPAYREDFERIALEKIVDMASFGQQCKENLSLSDFPRVLRAAVAALHLVWFKIDALKASFAQQSQLVIAAICKADRTTGHMLFRSFSDLIPQSHREMCRRLYEDIESAKKIELTRQRQRTRVGESTIDMNRFLPAATVNKRAFGRLDGARSAKEHPNQAEHMPVINADPPPVKDHRAGKLTTNPYKRLKTKSLNSNTNSMASKLNTVPAPNAPANPISALLTSVESEPYVQRKRPDIAPSIQSNAPVGLSCPVCSTRMGNPYIAECGHMACLSCWKDWLKRSKNCPTCRAPTLLNALAVAVFQSGTKAKATTGIVTPKDQADDSDGELELF